MGLLRREPEPTHHSALGRLGFQLYDQETFPGQNRSGDITRYHYRLNGVHKGDSVSHHVVVTEYQSHPGKYDALYTVRSLHPTRPFADGDFDWMTTHKDNNPMGSPDPINMIAKHHQAIKFIMDKERGRPGQMVPADVQRLIPQPYHWQGGGDYDMEQPQHLVPGYNYRALGPKLNSSSEGAKVSTVRTPDGVGRLVRSSSTRGVTQHYVVGDGFDGWYDSIQITADFSDHPDDIIPDEDNSVTLPYDPTPQGPAWDGTTSTIDPDIDIDISLDPSDSVSGKDDGEPSIGADLDGDFAASRAQRYMSAKTHFAGSPDDPILDVTTLPETSPVGLENSPINPDGVDTDDLFDGSLPHFERSAKLNFSDDLSFLRVAADEDCDHNGDCDHNKRERGDDYFGSDDDDSSDDSGDSDSDDSSDADSDGDSSEGSSGSDSGGDGDGGGSGSGSSGGSSHSASVDLYFSANLCNCKIAGVPLHSKQEHREFQHQADFDTPSGDEKMNGWVTPQPPLSEEDVKERYLDPGPHKRELLDLVDPEYDDTTSWWAGKKLDSILSSKTAAPAADPGPTQIESQIEGLMQFWAVDNNGWWHWTGSQSDLALLNQMQQQMMMASQPAAPGMQSQSAFQLEPGTPRRWKGYLQTIASDRLVALAAWADVVQKAKRLRAEGALDIEATRPDVITAYVRGDHGRYYTTVQRLGSAPGQRALTSGQVSGWSCECEWGQWAWVRKRSFVGRMCSHAYALFNEMRSQEHARRRNKGKPIRTTTSAEGAPWITDPIERAAFDRDMKRALAADMELIEQRIASPNGVISNPDDDDWTHPGYRRTKRAPGRGVYAPGQRDKTREDYEAEDQEWRDKAEEFSRREREQQEPKESSVSSRKAWSRNESGGFDWVSEDPFMPTASIVRVGSVWHAHAWADAMSTDSLDLGTFAHSEQARRAVANVVNAHVRQAHDEGTMVDLAEGEAADIQAPEEDAYAQYADEPANVDATGRRTSALHYAEADDGQDDSGGETDDGIDEGDMPESEAEDDADLDQEIAEDEADDSDTDVDPDTGDGDDDDMQKQSSVGELQAQFGLSYLAGADYSPAAQDKLVREGEGRVARNRGELNLTGTHYEADKDESEEVLSFLF